MYKSDASWETCVISGVRVECVRGDKSSTVIKWCKNACLLSVKVMSLLSQPHLQTAEGKLCSPLKAPLLMSDIQTNHGPASSRVTGVNRK